MGWRRGKLLRRIQLAIQNVVEFSDPVSPLLEQLEHFRPVHGGEVYLRRSLAPAVEQLDAIEIFRCEWTVKTSAGRTADRRTKPGENHVAATNFFLGRADIRARLLKHPRVRNLRHLLARFQAAG